MKRWVATAVAVATMAVGLAAAPAQARPASEAASASSRTTSTALVSTTAGLDQAVIARYDQAVSYSRATGFVAHISAARAASDPKGAASVVASVRAANRQLSAATGRYAVEARGVTTTSGLVTPMKGGHGSITFHWWGISLYLDEWATHRLEAGLAAGSGVAWVAAELTSWTGIGGVSAGAIAALLALGAGAIALCDWNDRGVGFHLPIIGGGWCWPR